jgi:hypothetical protein
MAVKRYNICVKKVYTKDGVEKSFWPSVGQLTFFPAYEDKKAGYKLEIPIFGNTQFHVFEIEDKPKPAPVEAEVNPNDVPY